MALTWLFQSRRPIPSDAPPLGVIGAHPSRCGAYQHQRHTHMHIHIIAPILAIFHIAHAHACTAELRSPRPDI
eukprot:scaffold14519_cov135-Isochrysis_galbana.AAC.12